MTTTSPVEEELRKLIDAFAPAEMREQWPSLWKAVVEISNEYEAMRSTLSAQRREIERLREALEALASDGGFPYLTNSEKLRSRISFARAALDQGKDSK